MIILDKYEVSSRDGSVAASSSEATGWADVQPTEPPCSFLILKYQLTKTQERAEVGIVMAEAATNN